MANKQVIVIDMEEGAWATVGPLRPSFVGHDRLAAMSKALDSSILVATAAMAMSALMVGLAKGRGPRHGRVLLLEEPAFRLREALSAVFETVVAPPVTLLPRHELSEAMASVDRGDLCIGGIVDPESKVVVLYRGDLSILRVPFSAFRPSGDGLVPDAHAFGVTDYGRTLVFGEYEAAFDAVLYEWDPDYRRRVNKQRLTEDRSFGASLRRLRSQKGLTLNDFGTVTARTIARIEKGEVERPHRQTINDIARVLGVEPDDISSW